MPAKQDNVLKLQKFKYFLLAEGFPFGRKIDAPRFMFGIEGVDRRTDGLSRHHHARAASERIIVAAQVLVFGIIADVHHVDLDFILFLCPSQNARRKRRKHFGKKRQNIDPHICRPAQSAYFVYLYFALILP